MPLIQLVWGAAWTLKFFFKFSRVILAYSLVKNQRSRWCFLNRNIHKNHLGILLKCGFKSRTWASAFITSSQGKPELLVQSCWASLLFWVSLANGPCLAYHSEGTQDWSKNYLRAMGFGWGLNFSVWKEKPNCHRENARSTYKPTGKHILKTRSVKSTYIEKLWKGKKNWEAKRVSGLVKGVPSAHGLRTPHPHHLRPVLLKLGFP